MNLFDDYNIEKNIKPIVGFQRYKNPGG